MFGYVTLDQKTLSPEDSRRYHAYRRALAQALRQRHGPMAQMALSHDLTFLDVLLTDVYGDGRRAAPMDPRFASGFGGYAADMSVALAFHNAQDDWNDDHNYMALMLLRRLRGRYAAVSHRYPRQCLAISHGLQQLQRCEVQRCTDPTVPAEYFGQLTAEIVAPIKPLSPPVPGHQPRSAAAAALRSTALHGPHGSGGIFRPADRGNCSAHQGALFRGAAPAGRGAGRVFLFDGRLRRSAG